MVTIVIEKPDGSTERIPYSMFGMIRVILGEFDYRLEGFPGRAE